MSEHIGRREALGRAWRLGIGFIGAAGALTTWDLLRPLKTAGFGGKVRAGAAVAVPDGGAVEVRAAKAYLVKLDNELVALSEKCTHLGCRVEFCDESSEFECPCHGSVFNRAGELLTGPSPRGLDRYPLEVATDGLVVIDTGSTISGPPPGQVTLTEASGDGHCEVEGGH
jgi:cytochrome b6-f complex iron-sulfur subunit